MAPHLHLLLLSCCCAIASESSLSWEKVAELYKSILRNHSALVRPAELQEDPVEVKMGISLQQLIDVDEKYQTVELNAHVRMQWMDASVRWNPEEYGDISQLIVSKVCPISSQFTIFSNFPEQMWTPDIALYNSADPQFDRPHTAPLVVRSDGTVEWIRQMALRLSCQLNLTYFPFDVHTCQMKFASWSLDGTKLNPSLLDPSASGIDISDFIPNQEWILEKTSASKDVKIYECCPEPYPEVDFVFTIRRRPHYYVFIHIMPCVLLTLLSLYAFILPPNYGERITLHIVIMLAMCVFQTQVAKMYVQMLEPIPFIYRFFAVCLLACASSLGGTAIVLNIRQRDGRRHKMSAATKVIWLNWLPKVLLMRRPDWARTKRITRGHEISKKLEIGWKLTSVTVECAIRQQKREYGFPDEEEGLFVDSIKTTPAAQLLGLEQIYEELKAVNVKLETAEMDKASGDDWKYCAYVVNRLFFIMLAVFIIASFASLGTCPEIQPGYLPEPRPGAPHHFSPF